jgi:hypothetical protein
MNSCFPNGVSSDEADLAEGSLARVEVIFKNLQHYWLELSLNANPRAENGHRSLVRFWRQRHLRIITAHESERLDTGLTQALIGA